MSLRRVNFALIAGDTDRLLEFLTYRWFDSLQDLTVVKNNREMRFLKRRNGRTDGPSYRDNLLLVVLDFTSTENPFFCHREIADIISLG